MNSDNAYEETVKVAAELYERSGRIEGRDLDNWLEAERIVRERYAAKVENKTRVIKSDNTKYAGDEKRRHKLVIKKEMQKNTPDSLYSKTIKNSFDKAAIETRKVIEKESRIKRLLFLKENEKTYLKSLDIFQTELAMIEEELQKAFEEMNQKKMKLYEIENEIVALQAKINKFDYRNRIAAVISMVSLIIFIGMLAWYIKPLAFLFGVISLGFMVYSFFNFVNSYRLRRSVSKRNQENTKLTIDLATLRKTELFCKKKHNRKIDMIEKQRRELEATSVKISEVKSSIVASEENKKHHYKILEKVNDNMSVEEKRKYRRRPFVKPIMYYLGDMEELKRVEFNGDFIDISEGGLGMITDYPLMAEDILYFKDEIKVNGFSAKSSTVRWSREIEGSKCRAGLKFIE